MEPAEAVKKFVTDPAFIDLRRVVRSESRAYSTTYVRDRIHGTSNASTAALERSMSDVPYLQHVDPHEFAFEMVDHLCRDRRHAA